MSLPTVTSTAGFLRRVTASVFTLAAGLGISLGAQVDDTKFSADRGFYDAPFLLEITTDTNGATLRYTIDGSEPSLSNGQTYAKPIVVSTTTVVRAAAFKDGLDPTDVDSHTYLFLDDVLRQTSEGFPSHWGSLGNFDTEPGDLAPGLYLGDYAMDPDIVDHPTYSATIKDDMRSIPSLAISLHPDDLFSAESLRSVEGTVVETRGIYPIGKGFERAASAELILPDGSTGFQIDCSIEIQGATSTDRWKTDKLSMRLKFKAPFGPSELDYPLFGDDATDSINTVILDSTNQQSWTHPVPEQQLRAQYLRDQLVGDFQNAMGGIAPHGRYAHVYLDGLYWGMYWLHEFVEEGFVTAYRGGDEEDYDILRHRADNVVAGDGASFAALLAATEADLSVPANFQAVADRLDIEAFADYLLCNFYAGNADWAFQNWNASAHRTDPERKWLFHNWDAEKTFQFVTDDNTDANDEGAPTQIHQRLRASAGYRLAFADRARKHLFNSGVLTPSEAIAAYTFRTSMIDRAVVGESARWGDNRNPDDPPFTRSTWLTERNRLLNFWFPGRTSVLLSQLNDDGLYPDTPAPDFSQHGGSVAAGFVLSISDPSGDGTVFHTIDSSDPREPGALTATSFTISQSTRVKARTRAANGEWSALTEAVFQVASGLDDLRVTELMFNPAKPTAAEELAGFDDADLFEFIELRNTGASTIDLTGVRFSEGVQFTFQSGTLAAGERILVVNDLSAFETRYGAGFATIAGEYGGTLSNAGETIALVGPFEESVQSFTYPDELRAADGGGHSLRPISETLPLADWDSQGFWIASARPSGSPGASDPPLPPFVINELHFHPRDPSEDEELAGFTSEEQFEFIEIVNAGGGPADLDGLTIAGAVEFTFGPLVLQANQLAVVVANPAAFAARYGAGIPIAGTFSSGNLRNSGERITLTGSDGELIHNFTYEDDWQSAADGAGASLVIRDNEENLDYWEHEENWTASTFAGGSPGAYEPLASASALRITEIMFNPAAPSASESNAGFDDNDDFEYIELTNVGATAEPLAGYRFDQGVSFNFPAISIDPGERVIIAKDEEAFAERYGTDDPVIGEYGGNLRNDGERIDLRDGSDLVILSFDYDDGWYDSTDGDGRSLTIVDPTAHSAFWGVPTGWRPSGELGGSPGLKPDPYAAWLWSVFDEDEDDALDAQLAGGSADTDSDGIPNALEYALGTDPLGGGDCGYFESVLEQNGDLYLLFSFSMNPVATDLWYSVEFSSDAETWTPADLNTQTLIDGDHFTTVIDPLPLAPGSTRLVRLRAEQ